MKIFALVLTLFALQAHASPLVCNIPANSAVIESTIRQLTLNDGNELFQTAVLWQPSTRLMVTSDLTVNNGDRTIKGNVVDVDPRMCAQICTTTTFELAIKGTTNGITPNATYSEFTGGFNEAAGPIPVHMTKGPSPFICNY